MRKCAHKDVLKQSKKLKTNGNKKMKDLGKNLRDVYWASLMYDHN